MLGSVSLAFRDIINLLASDSMDYAGINCPSDTDWQNEKHSVCKITFRNTDGCYICRGFLVNNVRKDEIPCLMSANHCINTSFSATTAIAYFNYENTECFSNDASALQTLSGAKLLSTSYYSDFTLLVLNKIPPLDYKAYMTGWDATNRKPNSGTGIHHIPVGCQKVF